MNKREREESQRLIRRITTTAKTLVDPGEYYDRMIEARRLLKRLLKKEGA